MTGRRRFTAKEEKRLVNRIWRWCDKYTQATIARKLGIATSTVQRLSYENGIEFGQGRYTPGRIARLTQYSARFIRRVLRLLDLYKKESGQRQVYVSESQYETLLKALREKDFLRKDPVLAAAFGQKARERHQKLPHRQKYAVGKIVKKQRILRMWTTDKGRLRLELECLRCPRGFRYEAPLHTFRFRKRAGCRKCINEGRKRPRISKMYERRARKRPTLYKVGQDVGRIRVKAIEIVHKHHNYYRVVVYDCPQCPREVRSVETNFAKKKTDVCHLCALALFGFKKKCQPTVDKTVAA